jgi:cell division septation protein DedD
VHGAWAVQAGTFASRSNAEAVVARLNAQGFAAYVAPSTSGRKSLYRVRCGAFADRATAERMVGKLKAAGHNASVIGPTR